MTGRVLPLTMNGSTGWVRNRVWALSRVAGVASTCPGSALVMTRAARLTVSPMTVTVARCGEPMAPANTWPRLSPARTWIGQASCTLRCTMWREARSSRPWSSSAVVGNPATRMTLPPSSARSVARKVMPSVSAQSCAAHTRECSASAVAWCPSSASSRSMPVNRTNDTPTVRCSDSGSPADSTARNAVGNETGHVDPVVPALVQGGPFGVRTAPAQQVPRAERLTDRPRR